MAKKNAKSKENSMEEDDDNDMFAELAARTGGNVVSDLESVRFRIDTGSLALNYSCAGKCIGGGIPGGRIIEAYGPEASGKSLIGSNVLGAIQKAGGWAIILDCENAINPEFMEKISRVNVSRVLRYTPSSLERAFRQIHVTTKAIRDREKSKKQDPKPILFVFDSVTVPPCERELRENNLPMDFKASDWKTLVGNKEQPGERAKIISSEMRKLQSMSVDNDVTVYLINQTRDKIGVMYGCVHQDTKVSFVDGRCIPIRQVVEEKMTGPVLSYNFENNIIEQSLITEWHINGDLGDDEKWYHILTEGGRSGGHMGMTLTPDHKVYVKGELMPEMVSAKDIEVGDELISYYESRILNDKVHHDIICGSLLGDGTIRRRKHHTACFSLANQEQPEYLNWKISLLPMLGLRVAGNSYRPRVDSKYSKELSQIKDRFYPYGNGHRQIPSDLTLTDLMFAVWYMDDGFIKNKENEKWSPTISICIKRLKDQPDQIELARKLIVEFVGESYDKEITYQKSNSCLHLSSVISNFVFEKISKYIPKCMSYKLPEEMICETEVLVPKMMSSILKPCYVKVVKAEIASNRIHRSKKKYDIGVEGNANYLVGGDGFGLMISNSPETTPGGNAIKFYASLRIRTQGKKKIEHTKLKKFSGINMQVKNVKNRGFRPFVVADDIKLFFESGIDPISGLLMILIEANRVTAKSPGNFTVNSDYLGEGLTEYKFKASQAENRIPLQLILDNPKLVDAETTEQVQEYIDWWSSGMNATDSGEYSEHALLGDEGESTSDSLYGSVNEEEMIEEQE